MKAAVVVVWLGLLGITCENGEARQVSSRSMIHPMRKLIDMDECYAATADSDTSELVSSFEAAIGDCVSFPCTIDFRNFQNYDNVEEDCKTAGGLFHVFSYDILCETILVTAENVPECWISQDVNPACDPEVYEGVADAEGCNVTYSHTGTTDYSGETSTEDSDGAGGESATGGSPSRLERPSNAAPSATMSMISGIAALVSLAVMFSN
jgi:hypothetical protein